MTTIAVVDYGMGNLRSVSKAMEHVVAKGEKVIVTDDPAKIRAASRVVFPGQGAAKDCMAQLAKHDVIEAVREAASEKPFLGICMGLQVLLSHSEENGGIDCLDLISGKVRFFGEELHDADSNERLKIPHMGWNRVTHQQSHALWQGIEDEARFYFVHSYFVEPDDKEWVVGSTVYGERFATVLARENVFACQFHPEKSAHDGLQLLHNFARWQI